MKNIYLVQPSSLLSGDMYLPYATASLAAYAWQFEEISNTCKLCEIFFRKDPIEDVLQKIEQPFFVGFSTYMWNADYNLALAAQIKKKYPDCSIAFGGPQVPDDTEYLEEYPFIDLLMYGEGEITFPRVLKALLQQESFAGIDNICYREHASIIKAPRSYNKDLSHFPSPYAAGMFDKILEDPVNKDVKFTTIIETNRGCPYSCVYCYWAGTVKNFRLFSMQRIKEDIDWVAAHKIPYCVCADSNFGHLARDMEITDYIIHKKKETGYPKVFDSSAAKNKEQTVFEIYKKLNLAGIDCGGVCMAVQSMSPVVLENIGRKNISIADFENELTRYRKAGITTYSDFILALPGETYESFMHGIFLAIEAGLHSYFSVHPLAVLPNTRLYSKHYREKFGIQTVKSKMFQIHVAIEGNSEFASRSEIVVATNTMTREEWVKAYRFAVTMQVFHSFGILREIALYLRKSKEISYELFYTSIYEKIFAKNGLIKQTMDEVFEKVALFAQGKSDFDCYDTDFSDAYLYYKEALLLRVIRDREGFFEEIKEYLLAFFDDSELFLDLFNYQKQKVKYPGCQAEILHFQYDWPQYFQGILDKQATQPVKNDITVFAEGCKETQWHEYTKKNVWYGKREQKMLRKYELKQ